MEKTLQNFEEWQCECYLGNRPAEPYFENEKPEQWARIASYAEDKLKDAFEAGQKSLSNAHSCESEKSTGSIKEFFANLPENTIKVICFAFGVALKIGILAAAVYIALKLIF